MGRKRKDDEERMRALREDPDYQALVKALKQMPQDRVDAFIDEHGTDQEGIEDAQDKKD